MEFIILKLMTWMANAKVLVEAIQPLNLGSLIKKMLYMYCILKTAPNIPCQPLYLDNEIHLHVHVHITDLEA